MSLSNSFEGLRKPEFTGENRCLPCTVANLAIAVLLAGVAAALLATTGVSIELSMLVGGTVIAVSAGLIYLRGYLVPGTPTLTKRYMPLWLLRLFGKAPEPVRDDRGNVDVEAVLREAGVIEECQNEDDLCLTESFESAWRERIDGMADANGGEGDERRLDPGIDDFIERNEVDADVDLEEVTFEERGSAYVAYLEDRRVAQWESREAYLADVAAAAELGRRYPGWRALSFPERTEVAGSIRLWLERCPSCGGPVAMDQETVESCCHERQVLAATCDGCGVRLFEASLRQDVLEAA